MGWEHEDLPGHEGWPGTRLAAGIAADPGRAQLAQQRGDLIDYINAATRAAGVDAVVPACSCGWRGVPVPTTDPFAVDEMWDSARAEWQRDHADPLLRLGLPSELHADLERALGDVATWGEDRPVAVLRVLRGVVARAEATMAISVRAARDQGVTWEVIGRSVGTSRQAAAERWGRPAPRQCRGCGSAIVAGYNLVPGHPDRCQDCLSDPAPRADGGDDDDGWTRDDSESRRAIGGVI